MLNDISYTIEPSEHAPETFAAVLRRNPQIQFVSLVGIDMFGHDTDEKIPVEEVLRDPEKFLKKGIQTDGSAVLLPGIAGLCNGRVDMIPDPDVNWYVDYNFYNIDEATNLPVGTVRIPSFLVHNTKEQVGCRIILKRALDYFKDELKKCLAANPYIFKYLPFNSADDITDIVLTSATEMEFYVKTPDDKADKEKLHTSQEMKEQYWKRTTGPVRTAMEKTLRLLNEYDFKVEMGHKEVGGVKPQLMNGGDFGHIMEQLEIDWRYSNPMQTADNDNHARYVIRDAFRKNGLEVSFMAKPLEGVAGSGKHTHFGVAAKLKGGRMVNLFSAVKPEEDYLSPIGYGALMGLLRNYEIVSPMVSSTNDAFNRLQPGFEAPVSTVTSLGISKDAPSRNRTVLIGLIRDFGNPMATRFELRSPNPKSNTYMVLASGFMAMLDGIRAALSAKKTPKELCASISKDYGDKDFYLDQSRIYRVENDIFDDYTPEERQKYFGKSPATVWEAISNFNLYPERSAILFEGGVMAPRDLDSYKQAVINMWATELHDRIAPSMRQEIWSFKPANAENVAINDLDEMRWGKISELKDMLSKDSIDQLSIISSMQEAIEEKDYQRASELQLLAQDKFHLLKAMYMEYKKNIPCNIN